MANLYQCAECYTTLYGDALPEGEHYNSIVTGELCSSCQAEQDDDFYDDDDWYEVFKQQRHSSIHC